jgi:cob(I)alamin adenosyltransferase
VQLGKEERLDPSLVRFLNRLSDALFVLARWMLKKEGQVEIRWQRNQTETNM